MDNTKELNLQETKEKLKKVSKYWSEITELGKSAIFNIDDPNTNWNKEIKIADLENIDEIKVTEQPKPEKLSEESPKKPIAKTNAFFVAMSAICLILTIICFSILDGSAYSEINYIVPFLGTLISLFVLVITLTLINKNLAYSKCLRLAKSNNIELSQKEDKKFKRFTKKPVYILCLFFTILSVFYVIIGLSLLLGTINSNHLYSLFGDPKLSFSFSLLFFSISCLCVYLILKRKTKFEIEKLNYKIALKEIENNKKFNQEEYPKLLQAYVDNINNTHKKISEIYKQIEELDIVSKSQAKYAQMLLDCIYNGAESVKEAFRVLEPRIAELEKQDKIKNKSNKNNIKGEENMIYNKTKRILELIAAIFALVIGISVLGASLYLLATGIMLASVFAAVGMISLALPFLIPGILLLAISICSIVFGALLIKSPVRPEGVLNTKSKQICLIVFSILSGNIVSFVLEIIVVCLPNFVDPNKYTEKTVSSKYIQPNQQNTQPQPTLQSQYAQPSGVEGKINELKHLKELGVIDEQAYSRAVEKIISEIK